MKTQNHETSNLKKASSKMEQPVAVLIGTDLLKEKRRKELEKNE